MKHMKEDIAKSDMTEAEYKNMGSVTWKENCL